MSPFREKEIKEEISGFLDDFTDFELDEVDDLTDGLFYVLWEFFKEDQ
jgi:hypothetical protein